jgi:uncharacterized protein (DUF1800 family)
MQRHVHTARALAALVLLALFGAQPAAALTPDEAHFLLLRTGFEPSAAEVNDFVPLDKNAAVARLLAGLRTGADAVPSWVGDPWPFVPEAKKGASADQAVVKRALRNTERKHERDLQTFWVGQMVNSPSPLTERLVLFWHNHFTSSLEKVNPPQLLWQQDRVIRQYAGGNFASFLHAMARDPAMTLYLDSQDNRKGKPNENFARELLELFTLGEGHYQEADIKEAARAFTGWHVDRQTGSFLVERRQHDAGPKTFLGKTGPFDGDDILDLVLDQKQTAVFLTEKLWREFVSPNPDPTEVARLADVFRSSDYRLKPLLEALFLSDAFWNPANRQALVKSPAQLAVGFARSQGAPADNAQLANALRGLGQDLFNPVSVKGWPTGTEWIDSSTLIGRHKMLQDQLQSWEELHALNLDLAEDARLKALVASPAYELY